MTTDILDALASDSERREKEAERNRADFPGMAKMLDQFKAANPRAIWCEENGKRIGRVPE